MRVSGLRFCWLLLVLSVMTAPFADAQGLAQTLSGKEMGPDGFQLYNVSVYGAYTSTTLPFGSGLGALGSGLTTSGGTTGPNYLTGIIASAGWRKSGARTNAFITYTPSYDASVRYFEPNSMNHFLLFGVVRDLAPRWTLTATGLAMTARWDQFLFAPTAFGSLTQVPATFDDLVSGVLAGKYTNGQLASLLTGAPQIESPSATLLYGTRLFNSSLRTAVTYDHSARLTLHWDLQGMRTQHLNSGETADTKVFLVPVTTSASASMGASYALSPMTFVDINAKSSRIFSRYEDAYVSDVIGTLGRVLGRRLMVQVRGGSGILTPVRQTFYFKPGPHYLAGGTITYKTLSHMFIGSFDHTITDTYGLGAYSANVASGAWNWHLPGRSWSNYTMGRYEMLDNAGGHNLNAWITNAGLSRRLDRHTQLRAGYMYGRNSGVYNGVLAKRPLQGVQLVLSWSPQEPIGR